MKHQLFKSKFQFWDHLNGIVKGLDLDETLRSPFLWFVDDESVVHKCGHMKEFVRKFNDKFGTNFCDKHSYKLKNTCVLFSKEDEAVEEVVESAVVGEELISVECTEEVVEVKKEPDWDWIDSLKSTQDDKARLAQYAEDNFDIILQRNKKMGKMVEIFKEELEKL